MSKLNKKLALKPSKTHFKHLGRKNKSVQRKVPKSRNQVKRTKVPDIMTLNLLPRPQPLYDNTHFKFDRIEIKSLERRPMSVQETNRGKTDFIKSSNKFRNVFMF